MSSPTGHNPIQPSGVPPPDRKDQSRWFAEEVHPHDSTLRGYLHRMAPGSEVDDLMQESYARILRAYERGPIRSVRGLLFAMARNVSRDFFRRKASAKTISIAEVDASHVFFDESLGAADLVSRQQDIDLLTAAIRALPERCRTVLTLRKFENLSHKEIAARLGITEHTVEAQLTKALRRCEEYFEKHGGLPR